MRVNNTLKRFLEKYKIAVLIEKDSSYYTLLKADEYIKDRILELEDKKDTIYRLYFKIFFNTILGVDVLDTFILIEYKNDAKDNHFGIIEKLKRDVDTYYSINNSKKYYEFNHTEEMGNLKKSVYIFQNYEDLKNEKNLPEVKDEKENIKKDENKENKENNLDINYSFYDVKLISSINKYIFKKDDKEKIFHIGLIKYKKKIYKCVFKKDSIKFIKFLKTKKDFNFFGFKSSDNIFYVEKIVSINGKSTKKIKILSDKIFNFKSLINNKTNQKTKP